MSKTVSLQEIRDSFINYFKSKNHHHLESSPLIPQNDPTLLFTNAGMVQFKNIFLGLEKKKHDNVVTCQKCIRVGGKHNDLEQIGHTRRHHTLFEMLGSFSFGGYFKEQAIDYAWEFLTQVIKLNPDKLYVSVHPEDQVSYDYWIKYVSSEKIGKLEENFWFMGNEGPCGPCTEIFYDLGEHLEGDQPGYGVEGDRFVEIWNLVFMSYEKTGEEFKELEVKCVDTGIGIERLSSILNSEDNNFAIPEFQELLNKISSLTSQPIDYKSKIVADHARSITFLIADGLLPGPEGREYILRKLIRRAARFSYNLGDPHLIEKLIPLVTQQMKESYPEISKTQSLAIDIVKTENERFLAVLENGMKKINAYIEDLKQNKKTEIESEFAFMLYDTYGFPIEITNDIAKESNLIINIDEFEKEKQKQKERSKANWQGTGDTRQNIDASQINETKFIGYEADQTTESSTSKILSIFKGNEAANSAAKDDQISIILDQTAFYGESGGQQGDKGELISNNAHIKINDTQILPGRVFIHHGEVVSGAVKIGDEVQNQINISRRKNLRKYHTATHLLHKALRETLGENAFQKGSLVAEDKLRFDFSHNKPVTAQEIKAVEKIVNDCIFANLDLTTDIKSPEDAFKNGAIGLFGEKYPEKVRVVSIGNSDKSYTEQESIELCGGTHVKNTSEIGLFKITKETSVSSGVRRIEALCGEHALEYLNSHKEILDEISLKLKTKADQLLPRIEALQTKNKQSSKNADNLEIEEMEISGLKGVIIQGQAHQDAIRAKTDKYKNSKDLLVVLNQVEDNKINYILLFNNHPQLNGNEIIKAAAHLNIKGGGKPNQIQGSMPAKSKTDFIKLIQDYISSKA